MALAAPGAAVPQAANTRTFISPMGEPFRSSGGSQSGLERWFAQADADKDGWITSIEMQQDALRFFVTLDVKRDREIDPDDIDRYENEVAPEVRELDGIDRLILTREPLAGADYDFNRGISAREFVRAAAERFRLIDVEHKGRVSVESLKAIQDETRSAKPKRQEYRKKPDPDQDSSPGMRPDMGAPY